MILGGNRWLTRYSCDYYACTIVGAVTFYNAVMQMFPKEAERVSFASECNPVVSLKTVGFTRRTNQVIKLMKLVQIDYLLQTTPWPFYVSRD